MGSIIIKPVQRIMKYPLILGELIKVIIYHVSKYNRHHLSWADSSTGLLTVYGK